MIELKVTDSIGYNFEILANKNMRLPSAMNFTVITNYKGFKTI